MTPHELLSAFRNDGSHEHTLVALFAEVERLRGALEFYADAEIYRAHPHGSHFDSRDVSYVARQALQGDTHD